MGKRSRANIGSRRAEGILNKEKQPTSDQNTVFIKQIQDIVVGKKSEDKKELLEIKNTVPGIKIFSRNFVL